MPDSPGLLARLERADADAAQRFGDHTPEVDAFISATARLTGPQWQEVLEIKRLVASVTKEGAEDVTQSATSIQAAIKGSDTRISEPMARAGEALFDLLAKKSEDRQVAAWQAMSSLVMRSHLPPLKFAVHYAPFAELIPVWGFEDLDAKTKALLSAVAGLTHEQCELLARRWRLDDSASRALLKAVAKNRRAKSEEAAAIAALRVVPRHVPGDQGWSALRTVVHGGRVLASLPELTEAEVAELWAPLEQAIPFVSLQEVGAEPAKDLGSSDVELPSARPAASGRQRAPSSARRAGPYGPGSADVAAFIKGLAQLSPIQWLRVLDRRQLVASVTREGTSEPASVVRAIVAAIEGTRELDFSTRCRAFAAVERASYAVESEARLTKEQLRQMYGSFAYLIPIEEASGGGFAAKLAALSDSEWEEVAVKAAAANEEAIGPLVNAGTAMTGFFSGRSDLEIVAAWHAASALVRRHQLTPIKFAASYAPFASAIPVTHPKALGAMATRYVTAVSRLGPSQCAALSQPWQIEDEVSNALSKAMADGSSRHAEEAAALAAVVTVPMRLVGSGGWAAVKTAAFGGRVIALRARLTPQQLEVLWAPIQPAIPLASLGAPPKARK
ncbi:MAG: hypothetical protein ACHQ0J_02575 [Candidatus Dormibacterales bacterium]